ncbi:hypothetical protein JZ751_000557 [Albula glossodonta]|uniref:non-specific serine/threonine protein kinase n=1 Tax=Albula glossodonta TaxID=121402 RepID=A0A8T2PWF3_9TELE|nr:hypothetical protein JZ751_000557 [Albula glossodonta]
MLVCGQPPFQEANDSETLTMIMDCKYTVPTHVSLACKDLINRMLQRDPKRRASLEEIENHAWLQGVDPSPATKYNTPLVSHKNLSEEEHNSIIQRMVLGDIADREAIIEILREKQEKEVQNRSSSPSNIKAQFRQSWPTKIDMHQDIEDSLAGPSMSHAGGPQSPARSAENLLNGHRNKGLLDLGRREEPSEPSLLSLTPPLQASAATPLPANPLKPAPATAAAPAATSKQRTCLFRVEEDEEEEEEQEPSPLPTQVVLRRKPSVTNRLTSRKSAPVLNQIFEEEGESDDDFDMDEGLPPKLSRLKMNMASPSTVQKRYHRRKSQGRGSSCSSSETSDDDSESHRRRLDKDAGFAYSWNRRDSSEGPPGSPGGGGGGGGQGKPPGEGGNPGPDKGSPPGGGGGGGNGGGGGGGGGGGKGQGSPSSCSNGSTNHTTGTTRSSAKTASGLVESLKLMSLCLSSQFHHLAGSGGGSSGGGGLGGGGGGGLGRFIMDPQCFSNIKVQERSSWRMCIGGSTGSLDKVSLLASAGLGGTAPKPGPDQSATTLNELDLARANSMNLKNKVLQLPLSDKTISVNIQRSPKEGLLCPPSQASCCQVI